MEVNRHYSQPCENTANAHGPLVVHVKGEPRQAGIATCVVGLGWCGDGCGCTLMRGEAQAQGEAPLLAQFCPLAYMSLTKGLLGAGMQHLFKQMYLYDESLFSAPTSLISRGVTSPMGNTAQK